MSIAIKEVESILDALGSIKENDNTYRQRMSQCDKDISDAYHQIETGTYAEKEGYEELLKLKAMLQNRRKIKNEYFILQSVMTSLNIEKTYSEFANLKVKLDKKYQNALGGFIES